MVASDEEHLDGSDGSNAGMDALHQCKLIQNLIEISISSLKGLRTKCAASNDLTQHEIRALEVTEGDYVFVLENQASVHIDSVHSDCCITYFSTMTLM